MSNIKTPTHQIVRFNCEKHSSLKYIGNLSDSELKTLFLSIQADMNLEKNMKLIKYYGYLHLFIINKK